LFGQDRGIRALELGIGVASRGFNVFVTGPRGSGRRTAVLEVRDRARAAHSEAAPRDHAYVYNFDDPSAPPEIGRIYEVNVVRDASGLSRAPVIVEMNPTFSGVFGSVDRSGEEELDAAFAHIQAGSLLRADGGYLVLYARDALLETSLWRTLIRTLRSGQLEIRPQEPAMTPFSYAV
jgi:predicted ATP-dependent protease